MSWQSGYLAHAEVILGSQQDAWQAVAGRLRDRDKEVERLLHGAQAGAVKEEDPEVTRRQLSRPAAGC